MASPDGSTSSSSTGTLATNRKASHDYHFLDTFEAGISLLGPEVKSIRDGNVSLNEAFARFDRGEVYIYGMHIQPYSHARTDELDPVRPRKLLLHRREIDRLQGQVTQKGCTLVPRRIYITRGRIKIELALAKGKLKGDKRESLKKKQADREASRAVRRNRS